MNRYGFYFFYILFCSTVVFLYNSNIYRCNSEKFLEPGNYNKSLGLEDLQERLSMLVKDEAELRHKSNIYADHVGAEIFKVKTLIKIMKNKCDNEIIEYLYDNNIIGGKEPPFN